MKNKKQKMGESKPRFEKAINTAMMAVAFHLKTRKIDLNRDPILRALIRVAVAKACHSAYRLGIQAGRIGA